MRDKQKSLQLNGEGYIDSQISEDEANNFIDSNNTSPVNVQQNKSDNSLQAEHQRSCISGIWLIGFILVTFLLLKGYQLFLLISRNSQHQMHSLEANERLTNSFNSNQVLQRSNQITQDISKISALKANSNGSFNLMNKLIFQSIQLPLKLPIIQSKGIKIQDFLYEKEEILKQRAKYQRQRQQFINNKSNEFKLLHLAKHNLIIDAQGQKEAQIDNQAEWLRLEDKFKLSEITKELPICIISPNYNNENNFRIEYSLNSIFSQNYSNYKVIIINDGSTDNSDIIYRKYFKFVALDEKRYLYISNQKRRTALQNFYNAATKHCEIDSIVLTVDGDDELIGRNVLKLFNWAYQRHKVGIVYSNFYWYVQSVKVVNGFTSNLEYTDEEKAKNLYRNKLKISHLRSFKNQLFSEIKVQDFKDSNGQFYKMTSDFAIYIPLLELSCSRFYMFKDQFHYLYNANTGINDGVLDRKKQWEIQMELKAKPKYSCSQKFDKKMRE